MEYGWTIKQPFQQQTPIKGVKNIIAWFHLAKVEGKSTVSTNLALTLSKKI